MHTLFPVVGSFHSFTLPSATGYLERRGHLRVHQLWSSPQRHFYLFVVLYVTLEGNPSEDKLRKQSTCLTDAFLPTCEVIPVHVVSKRKIYPNWGHEKCILIECHYSHTQNEIMWWDSVRKRFVMISLCIYNAHRTMVLSGSIGAAVVMIHSRNVGWLN